MIDTIRYAVVNSLKIQKARFLARRWVAAAAAEHRGAAYYWGELWVKAVHDAENFRWNRSG